MSKLEVGISKNGNQQHVKEPFYVLFEAVVATLYGKDGFYETSDQRIVRMALALDEIVSMHGQDGIEYAARVARFARNDMHLRTAPIMLVVRLAEALRKHDLAFNGMKQLVEDVIRRADQLTDLYSYALSVFGDKKAIPMAIKKGVAGAFNKFDAYQLAKYNRTAAPKFKDLLRIVHPRPSNEAQGMIFQKLMQDALEAPHTWEVVLSANGQLPAEARRSSKEVWEELITTKRAGELPYMAALRNLRNMHQANVDSKLMDEVLNRLTDPKQVARSKQLPWAFIAAYEAAKAANLPQHIMRAISTAIDLSVGNLPSIGARPWIILDSSSSMTKFSYNGKQNREHAGTSPAKIGAIFAASLLKASVKSERFRLTLFSTYAQALSLNPSDSLISLYEQIMRKIHGGGTNLQAALDQKQQLGFEPDAVVVLSDMEVNPLTRYGYEGLRISAVSRQIFANDAKLIAVNINSGATTPLAARDGWTQLAGFSPKIFEYLDFDRNGEQLIDKLIAGELPKGT